MVIVSSTGPAVEHVRRACDVTARDAFGLYETLVDLALFRKIDADWRIVGSGCEAVNIQELSSADAAAAISRRHWLAKRSGLWAELGLSSAEWMGPTGLRSLSSFDITEFADCEYRKFLRWLWENESVVDVTSNVVADYVEKQLNGNFAYGEARRRQTLECLTFVSQGRRLHTY